MKRLSLKLCERSARSYSSNVLQVAIFLTTDFSLHFMVQNSNFSAALNLFLGTGGYSPEARLIVVVFLFGQSSMSGFFFFLSNNNHNGCYSYYGYAHACTHAQSNVALALALALGLHFIPLVAETLGGLADDTIQTVRSIGKAIADRVGTTNSSNSSKHLFGRLAIALWRGNACLWLHRLPTPPPPPPPPPL